ncbi:MAG: hypothetical protein K0U93_29955 [Gammaproteobacteria bacterium]|nr:hypothetical protein [Gammaproteobacteria bacterium]
MKSQYRRSPEGDEVPAFIANGHDPEDPNPWLSVYLDGSIPIDDAVKQAWLNDSSTSSRQFLLPIIRPLARALIVLIQIVKVIIPNSFTSSALLHRLLSWGLRRWVSPSGTWLILRHFQLGAEILDFIKRNAGDVDIPDLYDMRFANLEALRDHAFLRHDLNLFNFVIYLNQSLKAQGRELVPVTEPDFGGITDGPFDLDPMPNRWSNFIDLESAIELFTPIYQLFLTDNDFWRAANSLQLDETVAIYASRILDDPTPALMVNNRHPMVAMSTLRAGARLVLHGLNTEMMHAMLVRLKREQAARTTA